MFESFVLTLICLGVFATSSFILFFMESAWWSSLSTRITTWHLGIDVSISARLVVMMDVVFPVSIFECTSILFPRDSSWRAVLGKNRSSIK